MEILRDADYRQTAWIEAARPSSGINHQPRDDITTNQSIID